jgi:hypothetical protein
VGGNNAGRSRVLGKRTRGMAPNSLLGQFLLFLATLFSPGQRSWVINDREGEASYKQLGWRIPPLALSVSRDHAHFDGPHPLNYFGIQGCN